MQHDSYSTLITGASRGLGLALVEDFLENTNSHVIAITRNPESLRANCSNSAHERLHILESDAGTEEGRRAVIDFLNTMPELRIAIHNAGKLIYKPFIEISSGELEEIYRVNMFTPFLLTSQLIQATHRVHHLYISSIGGVQGSLKFPGLTAYSTSKAAVNCLTEMLSEEFKDTDHSFNCLALGSVETEMFREAFPGFDAGSTPKEMAEFIRKFSFDAPPVLKGKIISVSKSNP